MRELQSQTRGAYLPKEMRFRGVLGLVAVLALLVVPVGTAAPAWLAQGNLSASSLTVIQPRVALDRVGNAIVVWERRTANGNVVQAAVRLAFEGRWRAAETLSIPRQLAFNPKIAVDGAGNAVVVWTGCGEETCYVQAAVRPARTGKWLRAVTLSRPGEDAREPDVAVAPRSQAIVAWIAADRRNWVIQARVTRVPTGGWGPVEGVSPPGEGGAPPSLAVDRAGNVAAVWLTSIGSDEVVRTRTRSAANGTWSPAETLSARGQVPGYPDVASSPSGRSVVVWHQSPDEVTGVIQASSRQTSSAAWSEPVKISSGDGNSVVPRIALDSAGNAISIWLRQVDGASEILESAARAAGASEWSTPSVLWRSSGSFDLAQVVAGGPGTAMAVWAGVDRARDEGANLVLRARRGSTVTGAWEDAVPTLSSPTADAYGPNVALDPAGNAVAVWGQGVLGESFVTQAAAYDAAGPVLSALTMPRQPRAGRPARFSVRPVDVWSPLADVPRWSFGDGTPTGRGNRIVHTYRAPGTYTLRVTQADRLGNRTTLSRRLLILPQQR